MNLAVVSLIVFFAVILFAAVTKKNCGVIALVAAYVFGIFVLKMKPAEIYAKGWPMGVFFIALSTTFLFAIANVNGTIDKIYAAPGERVNTEDLLISFVLDEEEEK